MKIRYFLITIITIGALIYGAAKLYYKVVEKVEHSTVVLVEHAPIAQTITIEETAKQETGKVKTETSKTDTIVPPPQKNIVEEQEEQAIVVQNNNSFSPPVYDSNELEKIIKKYEAINAEKWGEKISGIVHKVNVPRGNNRIIFLTFNAYTKDYPELIEFLIEQNIKSTIFLTGVWIRNNPKQAKKLGEYSSLFEIENHGNKNIALSTNAGSAYGRKGTENLSEAINEMAKGAEAIKKATGRTPRYVRSFLNYTDNVVVGALSAASIQTIGFTESGDGGGLFSSETIKEQIVNASSGTIILLNINPDFPNILKGLQEAIEEIKKEHATIIFEKLADYEQYFEYID